MKSIAAPRQNVACGCAAATAAGGAASATLRSVSALTGYKLRKAIDYIENNLGRDVTLPEIAQMLGMSPYHFAHAFKHTTGVAPHQYLIARRVVHAKSLLKKTDLPMREIAHRVGYSNQAHFSTLFHRVSAMTPTTFRQQR